MYQLSIRLYDTPIQSLPDDLYIPPEAFAIWLEQFEGPLDFLLYLVKKNNFDISTTAILPITEQYLAYIHELKVSHFELAGDYLLMASTLIAIKSELLLPQNEIKDDKEINPTKRLIQRLEEYAQIKEASIRLDKLVRLERDVFLAYASLPDPDIMAKEIPPYPSDILINSLIKMNLRPIKEMHNIGNDAVPLADRMASISRLLSEKGESQFWQVLDKSQGKLGVVVSFIAVLELAKQKLIEFVISNNELAEQTNIGDLTLLWVA